MEPLPKTNDEGIKLIELFEGLRLRAYPDPGTHGEPYTIGYGHTGGVKPSDVITQEQAEGFLREDLADAESAVSSTVFGGLTENQFSALVSFTFNLGAGGLHNLLKHGMDAVPDRILLFNHAAGHVMDGLTRRRKAERELFLKPDSPIV